MVVVEAEMFHMYSYIRLFFEEEEEDGLSTYSCIDPVCGLHSTRHQTPPQKAVPGEVGPARPPGAGGGPGAARAGLDPRQVHREAMVRAMERDGAGPLSLSSSCAIHRYRSILLRTMGWLDDECVCINTHPPNPPNTPTINPYSRHVDSNYVPRVRAGSRDADFGRRGSYDPHPTSVHTGGSLSRSRTGSGGGAGAAGGGSSRSLGGSVGVPQVGAIFCGPALVWCNWTAGHSLLTSSVNPHIYTEPAHIRGAPRREAGAGAAPPPTPPPSPAAQATEHRPPRPRLRPVLPRAPARPGARAGGVGGL